MSFKWIELRVYSSNVINFNYFYRQFSPELKKLYVNQNQTVNIFFKIDPANSQALNGSLVIRVVAVFTKPDDLRLPVKVL